MFIKEDLETKSKGKGKEKGNFKLYSRKNFIYYQGCEKQNFAQAAAGSSTGVVSLLVKGLPMRLITRKEKSGY